MELFANTVPNKFTNNTEVSGNRMLFDGPANVINMTTWLDRFDASIHRSASLEHQSSRFGVDIADKEGAVGIAVNSTVKNSDIDVDDVTFDEWARIRNAVANHFVY